MIIIENMHNTIPRFGFDVRVDRHTILGNPFHMRSEKERVHVCHDYHNYFYKQMRENEEFLKEVRRLFKIHKEYGKLRLFCWCAPKQCHAETIKEFLMRYIA